MPWKETCRMDARAELVNLVLDGESVAQAARLCGVSRKTAHKWLARYHRDGLAGLADRSRAPHSHPSAVSDTVIERIVALRGAHPSWGPRKLMHWLRQHEPGTSWPAASTIGTILKECGLTRKSRRRRALHRYAQPLAHCTHANRVWCADFKGWFRTGDEKRCDPLTITDGHSRYLLRVQGLAHPTLDAVHPLFVATFREYGLPDAIRTDNGVPFASTSGLGLSRLAVSWIDLGITPERTRPGHPEENGRHERMHRTLKAETLQPPAPTMRKQQRKFDHFQYEYNHERPHEALDYRTPDSMYQPSARAYTDRPREFAYDSEWLIERVYGKGCIYTHGRHYYVSNALSNNYIALAPSSEDGIYHIYYRHMLVAVLDLHQHKIRKAPTKKALKGKNQE